MNNSKGYGFRPSDEELIGYLRNRTLFGCDYLVQDIIDLGVDICNYLPWDLLDCTSVTSSDPVRYFIYPKTYKYPNSKLKMIDTTTNKGPKGKRKAPLINRVTNDGKWKISGERIKVRASDSKEIGIKTHLYFEQNSYPNKSNLVLHEYDLIDVDPGQNKYFLGKLMMKKQSKPTNISSSKGETSQHLPSNYSGNDHIPTPEVQLDFDEEPLVEMKVPNDYDSIQNQTSISERTNECINSFPVVNYENFVNDGNEVIFNLQPSNLVSDYAIPQNLQVDYMELIKNQEVPNIVAENEGLNLPSNFYNYPIADISQMNKYILGKFMMKQSKPTNISSSKGETSQQLPSNYSGNDHIPTPEVQLDFHQEPLVEMGVSNDYDWIQNQTSISDRTNKFINSFPVVNYENFVNDGNEVSSNLQPSNLAADYAIPQNLQVDYMELIKNQEAPNIVAENEGFNLPSNFFNYPIADISQMNLSDFDDLYWADGLYLHELFGALNNYDGVQNQLVINQQVAYELRNSNLIDNEIVQPDERNKSAAADEIEGSNNLPSLDMTESSYTIESVRKRSGMELEGSSIGIETEVAQPQAKKSRI